MAKIKKPKTGAARMLEKGYRHVALWFNADELQELDEERTCVPRATWCKQTVLDELRVRRMSRYGAGQKPVKVVESKVKGRNRRR